MIRLPQLDEHCRPFRELLNERVPRVAPIVDSFLMQWGVLTDELGHPPTDAEYDERWPEGTKWSPSEERTAYRSVIPDQSPSDVLDVLYSGASVKGGVLPELMDTCVVWIA